MANSFTSRTILLVDDDDDLRRAYAAQFTGNGFLVDEAEDVAGAERSFRATPPDIAILDFRLPDGTALELLRHFKEFEPTVPVIVLTGFGSMELGVSLIKQGAEQCLSKPVEAAALLMIVRKALENSRNQQKQRANMVRRRRVVLDPFLGESATIQRLEFATAGFTSRSMSSVCRLKPWAAMAYPPTRA